MTPLSHALFYTLLLGTSIISGFLTGNTSMKTPFADFEVLEVVEEASSVCDSVDEPMNEILRVAYETDVEYVTVSVQGKLKELELEEYVVGVLLAEMPSWYSEEALRAAAVAVRTYAIYKLEGASHSNGADLCDDQSHCQAFYTVERASEVWNDTSAASAYEKMLSAAESTKGEILIYEGKPILAVYHASSYKYTRSSEEVFGGKREYLQSVSVPFEDKDNTKYAEKRVDEKSFYSILSCNSGDDAVAVWEGSRCIGLKVGENFFDASRVRSLFSLASANFEIATENGDVIFTTYGYGHGVGLSQSGAGILAERGWKYYEILVHYYKGSEIAILKKCE